jgi:outer membrane receptor for ferrienterochelin and colicin
MNYNPTYTNVALASARSFWRSLAAWPVAVVLFASASSILSAQPASAIGDEPIKLEAFVSTGTRFNNRTVTESPVPIDIVTSNDINQGGYTETSQAIQALVPSFNFPRPSLTDGTDHIRPATLRGLAPDQTLVLINGKRRHTSSLVNLNGSIGRGSVSTDFNAIPTSIIGSIEVLRDGASAQYGSDAIAGVINVILRKDIGWGSTISYGATQQGDGRDLKVGSMLTPGASSVRKARSSSRLTSAITARPAASSPTRVSSISAPIPRPVPRPRFRVTMAPARV